MSARTASVLRISAAVLIGLVAAIITPVRLFSQAPQSLEYQVKAAFLLNFTKFVEWPANAFADEHSPLTICILGTDPFGGTLDQTVNDETVNRRKIAVERINQTPPPPKTCQVLFIGRPSKEVPKIISELGPGILTVGEGESFFRDGGMIAFVINNRRVRFDINQRAAVAAMLRLSSRLLMVARYVQE